MHFRFKTPEQTEAFMAKFEEAATAHTASPAAKPAPVEKPAANAEPANLMDKFKPKAGSWECQACFIRNASDVIQCPACNAAKPGHEEEVKKKAEAAKPTVTFGSGSGISFGNLGGTAPSSGGGFKFGSATGATSAPSTGFVFGSGAKPVEVKPAEEKKEDKPSPFATFSFFGGGGQKSVGSGVEVVSQPTLSFDGQGMKLNTETDAQEVVTKIKAHKNMETLVFSGNTVGIEAAKAIGKALETHPEFKNAHWKDMFTGRMKTEIPPALQHLSRGIMTAGAQLVELDLSDNAFGPIGMDGIVDLLKSPSCYTLKVLKLNNTGCGITGGKKLAETLLTCYNASKAEG